MTLTIIALNFWPWYLSSNTKLKEACSNISEEGISNVSNLNLRRLSSKSFKQLRLCLILAGTASIIRPTNILIWCTLLIPQINAFLTNKSILLSISTYIRLIREAFVCSAIVLGVFAISDRLYFNIWIFPPYNWLHFNLVQDLAIFYGSNNWHYYITEGLPQLLITYLPFTLKGMWDALVLPSNDIRFVLTTTIMVVIGSLSLISHKEVRFIYPLLPILFILTAPVITRFFTSNHFVTKKVPKNRRKSNARSITHRPLIRRRLVLIILVSINIVIAYYVTRIHQSGVMTIISYVRKTYETSQLSSEGKLQPLKNEVNSSIPYVAFLMPCHSTPFRSALIHPSLTAWALSCTPPVHIPPHTAARVNYRDEADRFYDDPGKFLKQEVGYKEGRDWPHFVVGFESIEEVLREAWESDEYEKKINKVVEKKRIFNSHWHDDPRRKGDIIFWELIRG